MGDDNGGNLLSGGLNQNNDSANGVRGAVGGPLGTNGDGNGDNGVRPQNGANNPALINGVHDTQSNGGEHSSNNRSNGVNGENGDNRRQMDDNINRSNGDNGENGDNRRQMDDNINRSKSSVHDKQNGGFNNFPLNRDDNIRSGALNNINRQYNDGYNRSYEGGYNRSNEGGYNRSNDGGYNRSNEGDYNRSNDGGYYRTNTLNGSSRDKDDDILSSAQYNRSNENGYMGGARPKTYQHPYNRSNEQLLPRLSIFEDNPRQKQYIFVDDPRQRQGYFEESRHRSYEYDDRYRGERQDHMDRTKEGRNTIPIPNLEEFSEFNTWKECIFAWAETTELPRYKQGYVLANDLPTHSERYGKHLKEDLFRACPPSTLITNVNGVQKVIDFLKTRIYIDEEKEIFEIKRQMSKIERKPNQNINDLYAAKYAAVCMKISQRIKKNYIVHKIQIAKTTFRVALIKFTYLEDGSRQHKINDTKTEEIKTIDTKITKTDQINITDQITTTTMHNKYTSEPELKIQ